MYHKAQDIYKLKASENIVKTVRNVNPSDIYIVYGYKIEVFAQGLDSPISMLFTEAGDMLVAESGYSTGNPRVLKLVNGNFEVIAEGFNVPLTGINYLDGVIYVSHSGYVSIVKPDGTRKNIIAGLPSKGDYSNSKVIFGPDDKMYFGLGTTTNSGVVGLDNKWVLNDPLLCDYPGEYTLLNGQNFLTQNLISDKPGGEVVYTGAFSPYSIPNMAYEVRKGVVKASGSVLRANIDGSELELFAWGFRNPIYMKFDNKKVLYVANQGYQLRGSRPIANAYDELFMVSAGQWYGWPDYSGGEPVTLPKFQPGTITQTEFLFSQQPNVAPKPFTVFPTNSMIMGFDFNYDLSFGPYGDIYISEFGGSGVRVPGDTSPFIGTGQRIEKIDIKTGIVSTFAINKSGLPASITLEGGFERPADVVFGPDKAMYVLDTGWNVRNDPSVFVPNTGVIWKITKN